MAGGHRRASSSWQELTPRVFVRPPALLHPPWVSNYVWIASFVSFLMALIPLPLHWTSERESCSNCRHWLPGSSILISGVSQLQTKGKEKLWMCPLTFPFLPIFSSYRFTALCNACKFVMKVTCIAFVIEMRRARLGAVEMISINCARLGLISFYYIVLDVVSYPEWWPIFQIIHIFQNSTDINLYLLNKNIVGGMHANFHITPMVISEL